MKKVLGLLVLVSLFLFTGCEKVDDSIKLGVSIYGAHGTRAFAVTTVVMKGDLIEKVLIDEFQYLDSSTATCVPNGDTTFKNEDNCLASKRLNNEMYSNNMETNGESTQDLVVSYQAIEEYAKGKTVEELVAFIDGKEAEEVVDAVSGSTLVDTKGYIEAIIEAVENAEQDM
jgi:major membrane immunogen (membrane-anchored lipoprotein)